MLASRCTVRMESGVLGEGGMAAALRTHCVRGAACEFARIGGELCDNPRSTAAQRLGSSHSRNSSRWLGMPQHSGGEEDGNSNRSLAFELLGSLRAQRARSGSPAENTDPDYGIVGIGVLTPHSKHKLQNRVGL